MFRADLHVHALMGESLFFFRGRPDGDRMARRPGDIFTNQVSLSGWRTAGIGIAAVALYSPPLIHRGRGHLRELLRQAAAAERFARTHEDRVELARTPDQARRIALSGRTAIVLAVEGGHGIGAVEDVRALHQAGVRMITLAHMRDNAVAAAAVARQLLEGPNHWLVSRRRYGPIWRNRNGLTRLGSAVVREMMRLGMLVDLAHASDRTFDDVLEITRKDETPLVASHTASRTLWPTERNIADEQAQAIVARRGVIGITLWRRLLRVEAIHRPARFTPDSTDAYIAHFRRLSEVTQSPAVVLGSDLNGMIPRPLATAACPSGVRHLGDWPTLERALIAAGVPRAQFEGSGELVLAAWEGARALAEAPKGRAFPGQSQVETENPGSAHSFTGDDHATHAR
jgi:membrane dipeptidase